MKCRIGRVAMLLMLSLLVTAPAVLGQVRSVEDILAELHAAILPAYNVNLDTPNTNYREEFFRQRREVLLRRADLIGELHRDHASHPSTADYLPERWETLFTWREDFAGVFSETQALVVGHPDHLMARYAWYWRAKSASRHFAAAEQRDEAKIIDAIDDFITRYADDPQGPVILYEAACFHLKDAQRSATVLRRIVADYPGTPVAREAEARLRQTEEIGKPFELAFKDAISGADVSIEALKGRVVVIDFWATWCGPCVEAVPHLKELYEQWQPRGVEFISVSLDFPQEQGGLRRVKAFVQEHKIAWPQYYQGNAWDSEFSSSWGVSLIPTVFVIDQQGCLHAAGVQDRLEDVVEALLEGGEDKVKSEGY